MSLAKVGPVPSPNELSSNSNYRAINWRPAMFVFHWAIAVAIKGQRTTSKAKISNSKWCDLHQFQHCNKKDVEAIRPRPVTNCCLKEPLRLLQRPLQPHLWPLRGLLLLLNKWPLKSLWSKGQNLTRNKRSLHSVSKREIQIRFICLIAAWPLYWAPALLRARLIERPLYRN